MFEKFKKAVRGWMPGYTVYIHKTPSGKVYVGITGKETSQRWNNGNGYRTNRYFWSAIRKYGWANIQHEIIACGLTKEDAASMEIELIARYKSNDPAFGYNHSKGGEKPGNGAKHTEEHKAKMSRLLKGRVFSEETRRKMSESAKKRGPETRHRILTDETKKKISEARKGIPVTEQCRRMSSIKNSYAGNPSARGVMQYTTDGVFVASYGCMKEAQEKTGCNSHHIGNVCRGKRRTCGGFVWRYAEAV